MQDKKVLRESVQPSKLENGTITDLINVTHQKEKLQIISGEKQR